MARGPDNRSWLEELEERHPVDDEFRSKVRGLLDRHGLLDGELTGGIREVLEETYRREHRRTLSYERAVHALKAWQKNLRGVADSLREARTILSVACEGTAPRSDAGVASTGTRPVPRPADDSARVANDTDTVH